jgi:hypothetical protein
MMRPHVIFAYSTLLIMTILATAVQLSLIDLTGKAVTKVDPFGENTFIVNVFDIVGYVEPGVFSSGIDLTDDSLSALSAESGSERVANFSAPYLAFSGEGCNGYRRGQSSFDFDEWVYYSQDTTNQNPLVCVDIQQEKSELTGWVSYAKSRNYKVSRWQLGYRPWLLEFDGTKDANLFANRYKEYCDAIHDIEDYTCGLALAPDGYMLHGAEWNGEVMDSCAWHAEFVTRDYMIPGFSQDDHLFTSETEQSYQFSASPGEYTFMFGAQARLCDDVYPEVYVKIDDSEIHSVELGSETLESIATPPVGLASGQHTVAIGTRGEYWQQGCDNRVLLKGELSINRGGTHYEDLSLGDDDGFNKAMFASIHEMESDIDSVKSLLQSHGIPETPLWVYYCFDYGSDDIYDWRGSLFNALALVTLIKGEVSYANMWSDLYGDDRYMSGSEAYPAYYVKEILQRKTGKFILSSSSENMHTFNAEGISPEAPGASSVPYLNLLPTLDYEQRIVYLTFVNTNGEEEGAHIVLHDYQSLNYMTVYELSAESLDAHPENGDEIVPEIRVEPVTTSFNFTFAPYSLTILELNADDSDNDGDPDSTDCEPYNEAIHHGVPETCDGIDNNCADGIDEQPGQLCSSIDCPSDGCGLGGCEPYEFADFEEYVSSTCVNGSCRNNSCEASCSYASQCFNDTDNDGVADQIDMCNATHGGEVNLWGCQTPRWGLYKNDLTTNLTRVQHYNNVTGFTIGIPGYARIDYGDKEIDITDYDLNSWLSMRHNYVRVDTVNAPSLNTGATVTLYDIEMASPVLMMGGSDCDDSVCTDYTYDYETLEAEVTELTEFYVEDRQRCGDRRCSGAENCSTCPTDCGQCEAVESPAGCSPRWNCTGWGECVGNSQTRSCVDILGCNESVTQSQRCTMEVVEPEPRPLLPEAVQPSKEEMPARTGSPMWYWIAIGAVAVFGFAFVARTQLRKGSAGKHPRQAHMQQEHHPVKAIQHKPDIMRMIIQHDRYGFHPHHIRHSLGKKGYPLEELHLVDVYFYLKDGLTKGHTASALKQAMVRSGWHPLHIERALRALMDHMFSQQRGR